ncbi:MAG TPA: hypothetical protein EYP23_05885 [Thermoplasmata archaeon]|nr:hypothetical protein [Thermoplasmata archaeon]
MNATILHGLLALTVGVYLNITVELKFEKYYSTQHTTIIVDGQPYPLEEPSKVRIKNFHGFGTRMVRLIPVVVGKIRFVGIGNITVKPLCG